MSSKKQTPKVRFAGYTKDWDEVRLKKLADFSKGKGYSKKDLSEEGNPIILYGQLYTNYQTVINKINTFSDIKDEVVFSKGNEVIVPSSGESSEDIVRASVIPTSNVILGGDLNIITPKKFLNSIFLALTISNGEVYNSLIKKAQGKSVVHIRNNDLQEANIPFPTLKEQQQIGGFFQNIDTLINQHQQKLQKLHNLKKAMLVKLFPKEGATVPEIRFKGFSGEWEEQVIDNIGIVVTGSTPSTQMKTYYSPQGIPWVTPTDIKDNITNSTSRHLSIEGQKIARIVPKNTILVTCIASIGKNTILGKKGSFNQQINGVIPNEEKYYPYFLFTLSFKWSLKMKKSAASGIMQIVSKNEFSKLKTSAPSLKEQQKIGSYFKNLDTLINQHQTQLEKLQQLKKACLNSMFV